jgi:hypothetical protein
MADGNKEPFQSGSKRSYEPNEGSESDQGGKKSKGPYDWSDEDSMEFTPFTQENPVIDETSFAKSSIAKSVVKKTGKSSFVKSSCKSSAKSIVKSAGKSVVKSSSKSVVKSSVKTREGGKSGII